ncbi:amino acid adenylation domain-containing protein [Streptomyces sp. CB03238]|uniref:amino acid adenylation domain-containing protein n=1 Tax=Streptomyces sp. CB03238 TaxID=1907777 RepID=UPI000A106464|nr:amino acid adenylation domain-containing protein [Streptomyces sp. CB03238]ORT60864.1 hypothetical protein BKD26_06585 [Streptomyces sp. CB03238]
MVVALPGLPGGVVRADRPNGTLSSTPRTVCDLLSLQINERPHATAVKTPHHSWTFSQLHDSVQDLSIRMSRSGVRQGTLAGLLARRGPAALFGLLAVLRCGAACLLLDPDDPPRRVRRVIEETGCGTVLVEAPLDSYPEALVITGFEDPDHGGHRSAAGPDVAPAAGPGTAGSRAAPFAGPAPDDLAYAITTSGSTGRPKAVAVPHDALFNLITTSKDDFELVPERDVVLWTSRPSVDVSVQDCLMALCHGATVAIPEDQGFLPRSILKAASTLGATVVDLPAAVIGPYGRALLPRLAEAGVRLVITGGSLLDGAGVTGAPPSLTVVNAYGPTEATVTATLHRCAADPPRRVPIGRPIRGVRAHVLDDDLAPVPAGRPGQLHLAGDGLAWGYLGRPARTAAVFLPDPFADRPGARMYATGDRVRRLPDGTLEFLDRMDNQVKVSGFRIEIGEVEEALLHCPGVRDAAVVLRDDAPGGPALLACLVGDSGVDGTLTERLRTRLPAHMIPGLRRWLDVLPLTPQGKVDRGALSTLPLIAGEGPAG